MTVDIEKLRALVEEALKRSMEDSCVTTSDGPGCFYCDREGYHLDCDGVAAQRALTALLDELEAAKQQNAQARAQRDAEIETVKLLDDEAASLRDQTRCPACGCATPEEAEANECGCNAPVCAIEVPTTLAKAYHDAVEQNTQLTAAAVNALPALLDELEAAKQQNAQLTARVDMLEEMLRGVRFPSHYQHHDPKGTAGANCPACQSQRKQKQGIQEALDEAGGA